MTHTQKSAKALYDLLDGLCGMVVERGWDGLERYYKEPYKMFVSNLALLSVLDNDLAENIEIYCLHWGIIESKNKENK